MLLTTLGLLSVLTAAPADTLTGAWHVKGDVVGNAIDHVCTFQQSGTALTGSCAQGGAALPLKGEVKEGRVTFQYASEYDGQAITVVYTGSFASTTELKGTIDVQPFGVGGAFTAAPAPKP